jgi:arylsulfatase A-like enzyme
LRNIPGQVDAHISMVDLAPTLLDAAGAPPLGPFPNGISGADGLSVLPTILSRGGTVPEREALLEESPKEGGKIPAWYAIRTTDEAWHYVEYQGGEKELYDQAEDPYELENLAEDPDHAETVQALSAQLARTK